MPTTSTAPAAPTTPAAVVVALGARGLLVEELQRVTGVVVDGIYGSGTARALGNRDVIDEATWTALTGRPPPSLFERCLSLTGSFEGHNYTKATGNWDGAGMTWGIIGFTLKFKSLLDVLAAIPRDVLDSALTEPGAAELLALQKADLATRLAWGKDHSDPRIDPAVKKAGTRLIPVWQERFHNLGLTPQAQRAQRAVAHESYWTPSQVMLRNAKDPAFRASPRAAALLFDCYVQQGGLTQTARFMLTDTRFADVPSRLEAIANAQAIGVYAEDVRTRRLIIARGTGVRGRARYSLDAQGLPL